MPTDETTSSEPKEITLAVGLATIFSAIGSSINNNKRFLAALAVLRFTLPLVQRDASDEERELLMSGILNGLQKVDKKSLPMQDLAEITYNIWSKKTTGSASAKSSKKRPA